MDILIANPNELLLFFFVVTDRVGAIREEKVVLGPVPMNLYSE